MEKSNSFCHFIWILFHLVFSFEDFTDKINLSSIAELNLIGTLPVLSDPIRGNENKFIYIRGKRLALSRENIYKQRSECINHFSKVSMNK